MSAEFLPLHWRLIESSILRPRQKILCGTRMLVQKYHNVNSNTVKTVSTEPPWHHFLGIWNRQVFGFNKLNEQRFSTLRFHLKFGLYLFPFNSRFGLYRTMFYLGLGLYRTMFYLGFGLYILFRVWFIHFIQSLVYIFYSEFGFYILFRVWFRS
jgi:hypothetical protein